jgi:hypothetical protein
MSPETQRGLIQAILSGVLLLFALAMAAKSTSRRLPVLPIPWDIVVASLFGILGVWFGLHALTWLDVIDLPFDSPWFLATGWVAVVVAIGTLVRWIRSGGEPCWDGVSDRRAPGVLGRRATDKAKAT